MEIWHDWLVLRSIPRNVSWLSDPVSVTGLVVLMEDWGLSCSPFSVSIWHRWVLWKNSGNVPPEQVWVVQESSIMELVVIEDDWSLVSKTSSKSLRNEESHIGVGQPASDIEVLNG